MWSCSAVQTPPSWPVIQSFGRSLGQLASTANLGAVWAFAGTRPSANGSAAADTASRMKPLMVSLPLRILLLEFLAAEIDRLDAAHVRDVVERITAEHQQIRGLALGERAEILVDTEHLRFVPGKCLGDLHVDQAGVAHQFHLPVLEVTLDEIA